MTEPEALDAISTRWEPPQELLDRHQARVLRPDEAVSAADGEPVGSTVYRAHELLVATASIVDGPQFSTFLAETLAAIQLVVAELGPSAGPGEPPANWAGFRQQLLARDDPPRAVALTLVQDPNQPPDRPVDAWRAAQRLRWTARQRGLDEFAVELNHLLFAEQPPNTFEGVPITHPHGLDDWIDGTRASAGLAGRVPLRLLLPYPARRAWTAGAGWRRVAVATLDTGCGQHPWLEPVVPPRNLGASPHPDPVIVYGLPDGTNPYQTLPVPPDAEFYPYTAEPLLRIPDRFAGHGTFIAGVIRQGAPDARIRVIRIMGGDGVTYAVVLVNALNRLLHATGTGRAEDFVDVVSLSLGAYWEQINVAYRSLLADVLFELGEAGVAVVASAGNDSTARRKFPAAFADRDPQPAVPLTSVGALNPNGSRAAFSNDAAWVTCWQPGAALVSTLPTTLQGSSTPVLDSPGDPATGRVARSAIDPDDYTGGFARWSGTSFAAPVLAAKIAAQLVQQPGTLTDLDGDHVRTRAKAARNLAIAQQDDD
ncbi:MAG: S8/S53 family peptidase [Mycobacteriales bacterium]